MNTITLRSGKEMRIEEKKGEEKVGEKNKRNENDDEPTQSMKEYKPKIPYLTKVKEKRSQE